MKPNQSKTGAPAAVSSNPLLDAKKRCLAARPKGAGKFKCRVQSTPRESVKLWDFNRSEFVTVRGKLASRVIDALVNLLPRRKSNAARRAKA